MESGETQGGPSMAGRRWTFGPVVLDERTLELTVNGEQARLERKPLEVLLYLLHHAGEVVTKDELAENIWPGRILTETVLTRCVSQLRQVLKDDERKLIRTVHGFGYRLVAEVRVQDAAASAVPVLAFEPGDHPPLRPQWQLVERLGSGGHGEAWLARHEKTGDQRVFKFALNAAALASLKREITLYRLLHDSLGKRAAVVSVFEWNLEELPYFLETEYVQGRDLQTWAEARGGLAGIPLEQRLEIVARVAEALADAHSVGVLHKDLKPGNVLIGESGPGAPPIRLSDFGSGSMLDTGRLEALGITNLGFTGTTQGAPATPLYLAPEIIAGQPFTVRADIYSLGVMMYQLIVADLRRPVAPGWELHVEDPLLREDIAATAAGDPSRRLAEAALLATRLRTLEERRGVRAAEAAGLERAARTQRIMEELRRTRAFALVVLVLAAAAVSGGISAYRARNEAIAARSMTQAINDFLTEGVLAVDPAAEKPRGASYESLLKRAASQVDTQFVAQPEAAASIHWLLGRRFQEVGHVDEAMTQYERASVQLDALKDRAALPALLSMERLIPIYVERGHLAEATVLAGQLVGGWERRYGHFDLSTLVLRARVSRLFAQAGELIRAKSELNSIFADLPRADRPTAETRLVLKEFFGWILSADTSALKTDRAVAEASAAYIASVQAGYLLDFAEDFRQAAQRYREALPIFSRLLGADSETTAIAEMSLALALLELGEHEESADHLNRAETIFAASLPPQHWLLAPVRLTRGRLELARRHPAAAIDVLKSALSLCLKAECAPRLLEELKYDLARSYDQLGDTERAIDGYRQSLAAYELLRGANHIGCVKRRISLADALRRTGNVREAVGALKQIESIALTQLPPPHLVVAEYKRTAGLLCLNEPREARKHLEDSLEIFEYRLGSNHFRTARARTDLALVASEASPPRPILINR